jgi:L-lactate dehydrogenase complex protein LldG
MRPGREVILNRIRAALGVERADPLDGISPGGQPIVVEIPRSYRRRGTATPKELLDLLQTRIEDYRGTVVRCASRELPGVLVQRLADRRVTRVVIPSDVPEGWLREADRTGLEILQDPAQDSGAGILSHAQVASAHAVLTGCALAIAETGTLVLDGGAAQGRRALTLLPDYHLCVVFEHQVVETVPEAIGALGSAVEEARAPITLISGPSATSDIELIRVEGVHGPRTLDVILIEDS